ncbi:MAG: lysophospholipase [Granulosicoccus sp.]|nr:lysophospholipase [Granulosicoccus sp.]
MGPGIHTHRWDPPEGISIKPVGVYLLHGVGEHAARYAPLAMRLAEQGYRVAAHDHQGHGRSAGKHGLIDPPGSLVTQAAIRIQEFAVETGNHPVLFGHSLGGVAATELVLQHGLPVSGLILSAPALVPRIQAWQKILLFTMNQVAPKLCIDFPYDPSYLTSDPEQQQSAKDDPLIHGVKSASLVQWLVQSGQRSLNLAHELDVDTLLLIAGEDKVVDSDRIREFARHAPDQKITVYDFDGAMHEILNETKAHREKAVTLIEQWLPV